MSWRSWMPLTGDTAGGVAPWRLHGEPVDQLHGGGADPGGGGAEVTWCSGYGRCSYEGGGGGDK
jgi:hypothetical protein